MTAPAQPDLMARIHFLGGEKISADASSATFTNEFSSPEARALERQTLDKLSAAPSVWFQHRLPPGATNSAVLLRPLLDDFLTSEWVFEMRDATNGSPEYALAIRLDGDRAQLWSRNLRTLLETWTKIPSQKTADGWRFKKDVPPNLFQFSQRGEWVVLDCGQDELPLGEEMWGTVLKEKETNWLTADLDWPRLAQIFPALRAFDFPKIGFQAMGNKGYLQFNGDLKLSRPLPSLVHWQVPTNLIDQPFVSFTAVRGLGPWLVRQSWFQPVKLQPQPEQFFVWALPQIPFQTFAAEPVSDPRTALAQIDQHLTTNTNWQNYFRIPAKAAMAGDKLSITGLPFISPYLQIDREPSGDFLYGGLFPNAPGVGGLPAQLAAQLNAPGLIYYHWELTSERLHELPELSQLILFMTRHQQLAASSAGANWLKKIEPISGANVTVANEAAPDEVRFLRTSPTGFTALESLALANWLDSPDFPALSLPKAKDE